MPSVTIFPERAAAGAAAAADGARHIRAALASRGTATLVLATGSSQFETLDALVRTAGIDWSRVTVFHLDEYVGLPAGHPASFRRYLRERFVDRVPHLRRFVAIEGDAEIPDEEISRLCALLAPETIDVCFAGIGENGHLAFNDPPADFETDAPYLRVALDEACRRQQLNEGWFPTLSDVPRHAISMSVRQMMKSEHLILTVSETRKAAAVAAALEGSVSERLPASIIQRHPRCAVYLDPAAAGDLSRPPLPV